MSTNNTLPSISPKVLHRPTQALQKRSILSNRTFNKGTAFPQHERTKLGLNGLLPAKIETIDLQRERVVLQMRQITSPIQKYVFVSSLKERNETLFYNVLLHNLAELLPIVYTPTVGQACLDFAHIWRVSDGMYFSSKDMGNIRKMLDNWENEVDIIVVTDGSRILGLGDLGANGMGIPIGKLSLYVVAAGFHPSRTLPVLLDAGTNNEEYLKDALYLGQKHKRISDDQYYPFVDEFLVAVRDKWPTALVQFEDFSNDHCFDLLDKYREKMLCFNDDIQGTGAVIASGFVNACKVSGIHMKDQKIVFFGAGSAGIGVADCIVSIMERHGMTKEEARRRFYFVDTKGLVTSNRGDKLQSYKLPYARSDFSQQYSSLLDVVKAVKPTGLIGLSGTPRAFSEEILTELAKHSDRPIIFSLSNPTSKSECTAEQAYTWTDGRCIFASGSPFDPVDYKGKTFYPGQGNNMYIFPGLGFGAALARATKVSDSMIITAAVTLAEYVTEKEIARGQIYPALQQIRDISAKIAVNVIETAYSEGLATLDPKPSDLLGYVKDNMYQPEYVDVL